MVGTPSFPSHGLRQGALWSSEPPLGPHEDLVLQEGQTWALAALTG